jgi:putative ABC transport system permease protein
MNYSDFLRIAYHSLSKNKARSLLTMLGIIIGVGSVITMLAIGQGSKESIQGQIKQMGTNTIMVFPGAANRGGVMMDVSASQRLNIECVEAIQNKATYISDISPVSRTSGQLIANNKNWRSQVVGVYPEYASISNYKIGTGNWFSDAQVKNSAKVCVVGKTVVKNLFGEGVDPIGQTMRVERVPFKIIGVLEEKGSNTFGQDQDDVVLAPFNTVQKRLLAATNVQQIFMSAKSEELSIKAQEEVEQILRDHLKLAANDDSPFTIRTQAELSSMLTSVSDVMIVLLASIAAISLLVGGIGIMNIMLVSVTERTREIGLRMSVGARGRDIMRQFLLESVMLSILGGLIGVMLGVGVALLLGKIVAWPIAIKITSIALSFIFASLVGIFFGWYPARKAAKLIPIEALRYE